MYVLYTKLSHTAAQYWNALAAGCLGNPSTTNQFLSNAFKSLLLYFYSYGTFYIRYMKNKQYIYAFIKTEHGI